LLVLQAGQDVAWRAYRLANPPLETIAPHDLRKKIE
jgi:hypothetical protein